MNNMNGKGKTMKGLERKLGQYAEFREDKPVRTYKIELVIRSSTPPDWIIEAIESQFEPHEDIKYFDYTIGE